MAFVADNLVCVAQAVSEGKRMSIFMYSEIGTAIATIKGASYMASEGQAATGTKKLNKGDIVYVIASDKLVGIALSVTDADTCTLGNLVVS